MKNNKGFTLVELLTVILILVSISLIAVSGISASLDRRDERECNEQKDLAIAAAKIYFSLVETANPTAGVTVGTLKSGGYFSEENKINRLANASKVQLQGNEYKFIGECS